MAEDLFIEGFVDGVKPRGSSGNFWTLSLKENPEQKFGKNVSFNDPDREGNATGYYDMLHEAQKSGARVRATYYESPNDRNPNAPFKNGTHFEYAADQRASGGAGSTGSQSEPTPSSAPSEKSEGGRGQPSRTDPARPLPSEPVRPSSDTYFDRTAEIEAAWAVHSVLSTTATPLEEDEVIKKALALVHLKRTVASQLKGWA